MALEMRSGFRENHGPDGMGGLLLSEQSQDAAVFFARLIAADAGRTARRSSRPPQADKPKLAENYKVNERPGLPFITKNGNPHAYAEVFNDAPHAAANEFGNGRTRGDHNLREAGETYHHRLEES